MWIEAVTIACLLAICIVVKGYSSQNNDFEAPEQSSNDREYWR